MIVATALVEGALARARPDLRAGPIHIEQRSRLTGGDINVVERLHTSAGTYILKSVSNAADGFFRAEADGLDALRQSGAPLRVPAVITCHEGAPAFLVLEDLGSGHAPADLDERIGHGLAALHRTTASRFGFARDNFCGATPQLNGWADSWIDFYGRRRLSPQLTWAARSGRLSTADAGIIERLIARLDTLLLEPPEGPALIHGDLWSGNLHISAGGDPALIDPAAYYAHREAELAMMRLFGGFAERVYREYHEAFPLEPGWQERSGIYQLYHLMNHLNLFGPRYHARVMDLAQRYA